VPPASCRLIVLIGSNSSSFDCDVMGVGYLLSPVSLRVGDRGLTSSHCYSCCQHPVVRYATETATAAGTVRKLKLRARNYRPRRTYAYTLFSSRPIQIMLFISCGFSAA